MLIPKSESQPAIATQWTFQWEYIKDLCWVHFSLFLLWKPCLVSSELVANGSYCTLYTNDLVMVAESLDQLKIRLKNWNNGLEEKGIKVIVGKSKVLCSKHVSKSKIESVKFPYGVWMTGVGVNSVLCLSCQNWVHKGCSGIKTSLRNCEDFICKTYSTTTGAVYLFPTCITINRDEFETVSSSCYFGDVIGQAGRCTDAVSSHIGSAWKAFHELQPLLTNKGISLVNHGKIFKKFSPIWKRNLVPVCRRLATN